MFRFLIDYLKIILATTGFFALPVGAALAAPAGGTRSTSQLAATLGISTELAGWILSLIIAGSFLVFWIVGAWVVTTVIQMLADGASFATIVAW